MTFAAAAGTLVVVIAVLAGPSILRCSGADEGLLACLRGEVVEAGLMPGEEPPPEPAIPATPEPVPAPAVAAASEPRVDLIRAQPDGHVIIAGSAQPGTEVEVFANGELVGKATTEASGDWVVIPDQPLATGTAEIVAGIAGSNTRSPGGFSVTIAEDKASAPVITALQSDAAPAQVTPQVATEPEPESVPAETPAPVADVPEVREPEPSVEAPAMPVEPAEEPAVASAPPVEPEPAATSPASEPAEVAAAAPAESADQPVEPPAIASAPPPVEPEPAEAPADVAQAELGPEPVEVPPVPAAPPAGEPAVASASPVAPEPATPSASAAASPVQPEPAAPAEQPTGVAEAPVEEPGAPPLSEPAVASVPPVEAEPQPDHLPLVPSAPPAEEPTVASAPPVELQPEAAAPSDVAAAPPVQPDAAGQPAEAPAVAAVPPPVAEPEPAGVPVELAQPASPEPSAEPAGEPQVAATEPPSAPEPARRAEGPAVEPPPAAGEPSKLADAAPVTPEPEEPAPGVAAVPPGQPSIDAIEIDGSANFFAGAGPEGATVQLFVQDKFIDSATVEGGRWLVEADGVLNLPVQRIRINVIKPQQSTVSARAEVNFVIDVPAIGVSGSATGGAAPVGSAAGELAFAPQVESQLEVDPTIPTLRALPSVAPEMMRFASGKAIIRRGETLWGIATRVYGRGYLYDRIVHANRKQIRSPGKIYPGQVFVLPKLSDTAGAD